MAWKMHINTREGVEKTKTVTPNRNTFLHTLEAVLVTSRKEGGERQMQVTFADYDGNIYLLSDRGSQWYNDILVDHKVKIKLQNTEYTGYAEVINTRRELAFVLHAEKYSFKLVQDRFGWHDDLENKTNVVMIDVNEMLQSS